MSTFEDLLGGAGDAGKQLFMWGILMGLITSITQPLQRDLQFLANDIDPNIPLSPADLATSVNRSFIDKAAAAADAKKQGINPDLFDVMIDLAGTAPAPGDLASALRRGLIPEQGTGPDAISFEQGIHEGNVRDKWTTMIRELNMQILSGAEWVTAYLRGQVTKEVALAGALEAGVDAKNFQIMFDTAGNPPSPSELIELVRRGFIPTTGLGPDVLSFQQGVYEGDTKDKWEPMYEKLSVYIPPPRTITTLEGHGSITQAEAQALYQQSGLSPSLAAAYTASASSAKLAVDKQIAKGDVLTMYKDNLIVKADAITMLAGLGYNAQEAGFLISIADVEISTATVNKAITKLSTLFIARKISNVDTTNALNTLGVPADKVGSLISAWTLEQTVNVKLLSEAQVADAFELQILSQAQAQTELENLGYSPFDAWTLLSIKMKTKLPNQPSTSLAPTGLVPTTGG